METLKFVITALLGVSGGIAGFFIAWGSLKTKVTLEYKWHENLIKELSDRIAKAQTDVEEKLHEACNNIKGEQIEQDNATKEISNRINLQGERIARAETRTDDIDRQLKDIWAKLDKT